MVAVLILSMALVSLMSLISSSLFYAKYSRNEITANYLLQEVIDSVKNERSTNLLNPSSSDWNNFISKYSLCSGNGCEIDAKTGSVFKPCSFDTSPNNSCDYLNYDDTASAGSFYNYTNGTKSNFNRKVVITSDDHELKINVTVYWKNGTVLKSRSLTNSVLNWP